MTAESASGDAIVQGFSSPRRTRRVSNVDRNPVIAAMITSNTLRDCNQVEDMVSKCVNSPRKEKTFMCQTAHGYLMNCKTDV
jgi:hypothetical protein